MHLYRPTTRNQSGFSVIEVLLVVLVVAVLVVIGFMVYQRHKPSFAKNSAATNHTQITTQPVQTTTQYLNIKEWGVRLRLDSDTTSLYYYIKLNLPNVAYLSLKTISDVAPVCAADKTSLGAIVRLTPAEQQTAPNADVSVRGTIQIGNYWYGYENSHAACTDGTATMNNAVSKAAPNFSVNTLQSTFKSLEAIPLTTVKIPELGIQITVPDDIKDLRYRVITVTLSNGKQATIAYFSTASLTALDPGCGTNFGPLGTLERVNGQLPSDYQTHPLTYGQLVKQFPTFFISAGWPQAGCSTNSTAQGFASTGKTEFGPAESTIQQLN